MGQSLLVYIAARVLGVGFIAILARLLTPSDFGLVASATVALSFFNLGARFGLSTALIQAPDLDENLIKTANALVLAAALAVFAAGELLAPSIATWFRSAALVPILRITFFCLLINAISVVPQGLMTRDLRARDLALIDLTASSIGAAVVSIPLAMIGLGYWSLVAGSLAQALTRGVIMRLSVRLPAGLSLDRENVAKLCLKGGGFTLAGFLNRICAEADKLIIGRFLGAAQLGYYARANNVADMPAFLYDLVIDRAAMPAFAAVQNEPVRLRRAFARAVSLIALIGLPVAVVLGAVAPQIIHLILGPRWDPAIAPLRVLCLVLYIRFAAKPSTTVLTGTGAPYLMSAIQLVFLAAIVIGGLATFRYGIVGVASAVAAATLLDYGCMTWAACRRTGLNLPEFLFAHRSGAAMGALTLTVLAPTVWLAHDRHLPDLLVLLSAGLVTGLAVLSAAAMAPSLFLGSAGAEMVAQIRDLLRPGARKTP